MFSVDIKLWALFSLSNVPGVLLDSDPDVEGLLDFDPDVEALSESDPDVEPSSDSGPDADGKSWG